MAKVDIRLLDPSPTELATALGRATRSANGKLSRRRIDRDRAFWQRVARRTARAAEGLRQWLGSRAEVLSGPSARVLLAWWTDYLSRRHYRVLGWQEKAYRQRQEPHERDLSSWPALCQLSPVRTLLRHRAGQTDLLIVCPCGTCGTPRGIAWMGDCCAACHDRREEASFGPNLRQDVLSPTRHQEPWVSHLAFSADGQRLHLTRSCRLFWWDLASGASQTGYQFSLWSTLGLVLLPDGSGAVTANGGGTVWEHNFAAAEKRPLYRSRGSLCLLAGNSGGSTFFVSGGGESLLLERATSTARPIACLERRQLLRAVFAGDRVLFVCDREGNLLHVDLDRDEARTIVPGPEPSPDEEYDDYDDWPDANDRLLAVSPDGRRLAYTEGRDSSQGCVGEPGTGSWWPLTSGQGRVGRVVFAPDNRTLAGLTANRAVTFWDVVARRELATLTWPGRWPSALAFSPDGMTLAVGYMDGTVQLWPWRAVLEAHGQPLESAPGGGRHG
jgi:hypothetical protein